MQIDELLKLMVDKGASDLHLKVPSPPVLRIDGVLMVEDEQVVCDLLYNELSERD